MTTKTCKACGVEKLLEDFPTYIAGDYRGRRGTCRACHNKKWSAVSSRRYHENRNGKRDKDKARALVAARSPEKKIQRRRREVEWASRHPQKVIAKSMVSYAIKTGRLVRQPCGQCGTTVRVQAHHDDYSKPLDVLWLCPFHHGERHRLLNRGLLNKPNDQETKP